MSIYGTRMVAYDTKLTLQEFDDRCLSHKSSFLVLSSRKAFDNSHRLKDQI